jgi:hypothetical protein
VGAFIMAMELSTLIGTNLVSNALAQMLFDRDDVSKAFLQDIRNELVEIKEYLRLSQQPEIADLYHVVTLYKVGQGSIFIPYPENRIYIRIFSPTLITLDASGVLGTFPITLQPAIWTPLDLPDGTSYIIDASYANNSTNVYIRYTNDKP